MLGCEGVEHGEHWSGADAGADQQDRRRRPVEDEGAAGCSDFELIADPKAGVQVAAGYALAFTLDGDPVVAGPWRPGHRVIAEHRRLVVVGFDAQCEVLTGLG